jgi:hypothetical protein
MPALGSSPYFTPQAAKHTTPNDLEVLRLFVAALPLLTATRYSYMIPEYETLALLSSKSLKFYLLFPQALLKLS